MPAFVALDLETTGLDPQSDEIIDIGAVRFTARRMEDEFATLVRPQQHIRGFITRLTGINDDMVAAAPRLSTVLPQLLDFVGDAVIIGHNVQFDLNFLAAAGISFLNPVVDTYELASVLLPDASRYALGALGQALDIPLRATHRALDDARVTAHLYRRLVDKAEALPLDLIAAIVRLGVEGKWLGTWPFQQILFRKQKQGQRGRSLPTAWQPPEQAPVVPRPPQAKAEKPVDPDAVAALLAPEGALARRLPTFEHRPQQVTMARAVAEAFSQPHHLIVEAGTGTGKSIAYLLPAALFALENNTRVVISTNTKNLQEQLLQKDIPIVQAALDQPLRAAVLKGRNNYLCPHRFHSLLEQGARRPEEARVLAKVLVWLHQGGSGDRGEINLRGGAEQAVWRRISAESPACTAAGCMRFSGGACPFQQARHAAEQAHLLVVNHALLFSDVAAANRVLPEYNYLVVDEAHHLESAITQAMSFEVTEDAVRRLFTELGGTKAGLLGRLILVTRRSGDALRTAARHHAEILTGLAFRTQEAIKATFATLHDFVEDDQVGRPPSQYAQQLRLTPAIRQRAPWEAVLTIWEEAFAAARALDQALVQLRRDLLESTAEEDDPLRDVLNEIEAVRSHLTEMTLNLHALLMEPAPKMVYWLERNPRSRWLALRGAPLEIGADMREHLWEAKPAVVLTSATLSAGGDFSYLRQRLAAEEAEELLLGSPFDYRQAALLYVVNDIPEPNRPGYQQAVERGILELAKATHGRLLALFTSYTQLQRTSQAITPGLLEAGITVYEQGSGASPQALLDEFRQAEGAVLLGTRSFWEGVDVPGDALSALVIVKLPFAVPSDPLVAARAETFTNPFEEYHLPEAVLAFRQGFGRLIRTRTDRGIVAVFDRRLLTRRYGRAFLDALPPCTRHQGPMHRLPAVAARWLSRDGKT